MGTWISTLGITTLLHLARDLSHNRKKQQWQKLIFLQLSQLLIS